MQTSRSRVSLLRRFLLLTVVGALLVMAIPALTGYFAVRESTQRALEERLVLAQISAEHLEYILQQGIRRLEEIRVYDGAGTPAQSFEEAKLALRDVYFQSVFDDRVFLMDPQGQVTWTEPYISNAIGENLSDYHHVKEALASGKPVVSSVVYLQPSNRPVVSAVAPLKDRDGRIIGWAGGNIDITGSSLRTIIEPVKLGNTGYIEVVDSQGLVLASTRAEVLLTPGDHLDIVAQLIQRRQSTVSACHTCHVGQANSQRETEVMAFAPLSTIPWGVSIRQLESEALAPARNLARRLLIFGSLLFLVLVLFAVAMARSVVRPIRALTSSARRIAGGDLSQPIPSLSNDEIGDLGHSLDSMRVKLKDSLDAIQEWNRVLEARVQERTKELEESREARETLLRRLMSAQEEERRRIARELHDETSQNIALLAMNLDVSMDPAKLDHKSVTEHISQAKGLALKTLEEVHRIIIDLRPSILDDLGLLAALHWYAEARLGSQGVRVHWELPEVEKRLPAHIETALFRIVQEAITNIAKHAEAQNVIISLAYEDDSVAIEIEDDGKGFDPKEAMPTAASARGLGVLGMKERVSLLNGVFKIDSQPGEGTYISIKVPLSTKEAASAEDTSANSR